MHKDPPPGLFDARRSLSHVVTHGLIAGFLLALVLHFAWSLIRQNAAQATARPAGIDALVSGMHEKAPAAISPPPAAPR
ncbi:MAG: hypothetical protein M3032_06080 [Verrucomicrobiota bacterium]|nr:hypothetical protein [Verrucomicrobiota bacterium]